MVKKGGQSGETRLCQPWVEDGRWEVLTVADLVTGEPWKRGGEGQGNGEQ